jgi:ubiquinone biosynthesis accessory factor UbiK
LWSLKLQLVALRCYNWIAGLMPSFSGAHALSFLSFSCPIEGAFAPLLNRCLKGAHHAKAPSLHPHHRSAIFCLRTIMDKPNFFNDLQAKINQAIENSPAKDIEKNVKAMLTQGFSRLDLVTREEFDIQSQVLAKTRAKLEALEARVAELEALQKKP